MTNICASIGVAQLEYVKEILQKKRVIAKRYISNLNQLKSQTVLPGSINSYWLNVFRLNNKKSVKKVREALKNNNIETRPFFSPLHKMPHLHSKQKFIISEKLSEQGVCLPSFPELKIKEIDKICDIIIKNNA